MVGQAVMMAGFSGMYGAQRPAMKESANEISMSTRDQAETQSITSIVKDGIRQKQSVSVLSLQAVTEIQVLRHFGRTSGQFGW